MALATRARIAGILSLCLLLSSLGATGALAGAAPPGATVDAASATIGTNSCQGLDACTGATGDIGNNSCNGERACEGHSGDVGNNSCIDYAACVAHTGDVGDYSCNGYTSCGNHQGSVGDGSCNGDNACESGVGGVANYSCNGDSACREFEISLGDCVFNTTVPPICEVQPDARVRRIGKHNMVGNDIYNTDGTNQTLTDTLGDRRVRFVITIQNDGDAASSFTIGSSNGVTLNILPPVNFYHGWNPAEDITAAVMAGTYTTPTIQPGGVYRIRAVVRPLQINFNHLTAGPGIGHYSWLVTATNTVGNPAKADAVRFEVDVPFT